VEVVTGYDKGRRFWTRTDGRGIEAEMADVKMRV